MAPTVFQIRFPKVRSREYPCEQLGALRFELFLPTPLEGNPEMGIPGLDPPHLFRHG